MRNIGVDILVEYLFGSFSVIVNVLSNIDFDVARNCVFDIFRLFFGTDTLIP